MPPYDHMPAAERSAYSNGFEAGAEAERKRCAKIADEAQRLVEETGPAPYVASEIARKIRDRPALT